MDQSSNYYTFQKLKKAFFCSKGLFPTFIKNMKLKDISPENRPLERLERQGEESLSNAELLALILKTGTKETNVIDICYQILSEYSFDRISNCSLNQLQNIKGIGKVKASQIKAIFELSKRINSYEDHNKKIISISQITNLLSSDFKNQEKEILIVVFLNYNTLISKKKISIGTSNCTLISQKDILREAIKENSNAIILSHNHPSGLCYPSKEDIEETRKLSYLANKIDINVLDHIIFTQKETYSFRKNNIL